MKLILLYHPELLAIRQNDISCANEPPMSIDLPTFPVSQGWLLIAGSTV